MESHFNFYIYKNSQHIFDTFHSIEHSIVPSSNISLLEAHPGIYRLILKGFFDA